MHLELQGFFGPSSNKTMKQLSQYEMLNDGNLFLVSTNKESQEIQDNHIITASITANIPGENNFIRDLKLYQKK